MARNCTESACGILVVCSAGADTGAHELGPQGGAPVTHDHSPKHRKPAHTTRSVHAPFSVRRNQVHGIVIPSASDTDYHEVRVRALLRKRPQTATCPGLELVVSDVNAFVGLVPGRGGKFCSWRQMLRAHQRKYNNDRRAHAQGDLSWCHHRRRRRREPRRN